MVRIATLNVLATTYWNYTFRKDVNYEGELHREPHNLFIERQTANIDRVVDYDPEILLTQECEMLQADEFRDALMSDGYRPFFAEVNPTTVIFVNNKVLPHVLDTHFHKKSGWTSIAMKTEQGTVNVITSVHMTGRHSLVRRKQEIESFVESLNLWINAKNAWGFKTVDFIFGGDFNNYETEHYPNDEGKIQYNTIDVVDIPILLKIDKVDTLQTKHDPIKLEDGFIVFNYFYDHIYTSQGLISNIVYEEKNWGDPVYQMQDVDDDPRDSIILRGSDHPIIVMDVYPIKHTYISGIGTH